MGFVVQFYFVDLFDHRIFKKWMILISQEKLLVMNTQPRTYPTKKFQSIFRFF